MNLGDGTYYDILEISPDASPKAVNEAYLRMKAAYNKDSVALYTLISSDEREETLRKIEEAYNVLSNPERRKQYDVCQGMSVLEQPAVPAAVPASSQDFHEILFGDEEEASPVVSIDRVPPMEAVANSAEFLVPPSTDFREAPPPRPAPAFEAPPPRAHEPPAAPAAPIAGKAPTTTLDNDLLREITQEVEWRGSLLRRVREAHKISIEEMSATTRISKTYLTAIEAEAFNKLPAPVFLRGFVTQVAKILKLPHDKVAAAYLARYYQAKPEQK